MSPPTWLKPWLCYKQSLTKKLEHLTGEAKLIILKQVWLGAFWQREILMTSQNRHCWYAKTLVPKSTYQVYVHLFAAQEQPLGHIIFSQPEIHRLSLRHFVLPEKDKNTLSYTQMGEEFLWTRESKWLFNTHHSFTIQEIFLPGLKDLL